MGAVETAPTKKEEIKTTAQVEESKIVEQVKESVPAVTIPKVVLPSEPENKTEKVAEVKESVQPAVKEITTNLSTNTIEESAPDRNQGGILNLN